MSINEMKALLEKKEIEKALNEAKEEIDNVVMEEAEKLSQKLVDEGHDPDSFEINTRDYWEGDKLVVELAVVKVESTIEFRLEL